MLSVWHWRRFLEVSVQSQSDDVIRVEKDPMAPTHVMCSFFFLFSMKSTVSFQRNEWKQHAIIFDRIPLFDSISKHPHLSFVLHFLQFSFGTKHFVLLEHDNSNHQNRKTLWSMDLTHYLPFHHSRKCLPLISHQCQWKPLLDRGTSSGGRTDGLVSL